MRILLIVDTQKYKYHGELFIDFENALVNHYEDDDDCSLEVIDISTFSAEYEAYEYISGTHPDLIITLDCAGFDMLTTSGSISYNSIPCRMAHVLLKKRELYSAYLNNRQNFSMYTYFSDECDEQWNVSHPWITNTGYIDNVIYKNIDDDAHETNVITIEKWLNQALEDMRYEITDI